MCPSPLFDDYKNNEGDRRGHERKIPCPPFSIDDKIPRGTGKTGLSQDCNRNLLHSWYMNYAKLHTKWLMSRGQEFVGVPMVNAAWQKDREAFLVRYFNPGLLLREILPCEIVVEYDGYPGHSRQDALDCMRKTTRKLAREGIAFIVFDHGGKSPHLHLWIDDLDLLDYADRTAYKEAFIRKYCDSPQKVDLSLASKHLIAFEYARHWKYNTLKFEALNHLPMAKLNDVSWDVPCALCDGFCCEWVDVRGVFYCDLCHERSAHGILLLGEYEEKEEIMAEVPK